MSEKFQLLNKLAGKGSTFSFKEAQKISNLSPGSLKVLLYRMEKEGWVERIEKGKYLIIPLGAEKGRYTINEFVIGYEIVKNAAIAYWSALNYHGFTEQIPNTVFIQTTSRKKEPKIEIFGVRYRIVRITEKKLFGLQKIWIDDAEVWITDPEKTIADCLDKPQYCGGIVEVAKAIKNEDEIDLDKVIEYAIKMENSAILKRLGSICDRLVIPVKIPQDYLAKGYPLLDPSIHRKGKANRKWKIIENVDEKIIGTLE
jgi:predicted transcriptional regulator of viral defense system